ncbi:MAG: pyridoxal-phosphate dependent enzyme [Gemmatimonadota bacterium]|nr:pyridoxal-phosphate dependent enzyme [Gemmatimonadota bacterium]
MRALHTRFPGLASALPSVDLRVAETPVEQWSVGDVRLLAKRDDLSSPTLGGNKVRALELLLAGVGPDHRLLTVGSTGSTHALAVAQYGLQLGAETDVITWPQEENAVSLVTSIRLGSRARVTAAGSPVEAYLRAAVRRLSPRVRWIPAGGSSALGTLGHASAALELITQLSRDDQPMPEWIVVPLGSGGTVAGLLLGLALAGVPTRVVGVRVVPRSVGNRWRVLYLARRGRALLKRLTRASMPDIDASRLVIEQDAFGGAYGRETEVARNAAAALHVSGGPVLDGTYSAKAFGHALARAQGARENSVLFWLTFDGRWLEVPYEETPVLRPTR